MPSKIINADVVCEKCGRHVAIKYESTLRKNITKNGMYVCTSCDKKSDQRRARMSLALKEKWNDQAYRRKMSSIERDNEKISEALKEKWCNDEYRRKNVA